MPDLGDQHQPAWEKRRVSCALDLEDLEEISLGWTVEETPFPQPESNILCLSTNPRLTCACRGTGALNIQADEATATVGAKKIACRILRLAARVRAASQVYAWAVTVTGLPELIINPGMKRPFPRVGSQLKR